jgi:hypothetical protein
MKHIITILVAVTIYLVAASPVYGEPLDSFEVSNAYKFIADIDDDGLKFIRVDGKIQPNFGMHLATFIHRNFNAAYIELSSPGGLLSEIDIVGRKIKKLSIPVVIRSGDACVSACAYLALYSKDITINGQLAFHMPYFRNFDSEMTLSEVSKSSVTNTMSLVRNMYSNGWTMILFYFISEQTSRNTYIVFLDEIYLDAYRISDEMPFDATSVTRNGKWSIFSNTDIIVYQNLQRD